MSAGEQRLNFIHIDDVVVAIASAMRRIMVSPEGTKESFALRGSQTLSLRQFVSLFERATQWRVAVAWGARPYRPREVMQPWLGPLLPDWEARIPLFDGLRALRDSLPNV
jgi:nucleoside-diphosphate-sugar epimerase